MNNKSTDRSTQLLEGAYGIKTVEDNIEYYRDFADIYDSEFADSMAYIYPAMLAEVFTLHRIKSDSPIVDIGCGTGLVASALHRHELQQNKNSSNEIDGIDLSKEMLDAAKNKNIYRALYQADLTQAFNHLPDGYGAVLSAGTFTFGHLGPDILPELLQLGRTGTLYCIGVNSEHFEEQGFSRTLDSMVDESLISPPVAEIRKIYDLQNAGKSSHADDTARVMVYRQL